MRLNDGFDLLEMMAESKKAAKRVYDETRRIRNYYDNSNMSVIDKQRNYLDCVKIEAAVAACEHYHHLTNRLILEREGLVNT